MRRQDLIAALFLAIVLVPISGLLQSCYKVPITGRRHVLLVPEGRENALGAQSYQEILKEEKVSSNKTWSDMVTRVGKRIAAVTGEKDYDWDYKLIASDTVNAFCLPGGKVAFYEGILPMCLNEAGIAIVMGHEVGHAIARHGGERMSQNILVQMGALGISIATKDKSEQERLKLLGAYGAAATLGFVLPFSRKHETEADHIGLMYMAMAGYDPVQAPAFWDRMAAEGAKVPAFLSTHPSDKKRAEDLEALMPQAKKLYNAAKTKYGIGDPIPGLGSGGSKKDDGGSDKKDSGSPDKKDSGSSDQSDTPEKKDSPDKKPAPKKK